MKMSSDLKFQQTNNLKPKKAENTKKNTDRFSIDDGKMANKLSKKKKQRVKGTTGEQKKVSPWESCVGVKNCLLLYCNDIM